MSRSETGVPTQVAVATIDERSLGAEARGQPAADTLLATRYRIGRRIGKGGMGEVMAARDEQVGRDVAIKRMKAANPHPRAIARFVREASIQGRLEHPSIPPVHEIGRDAEGLPFFAMKKLTGVTLAKLLEGDDLGFPLQRVLRAFTDVCLAVELAHVRGIVHRDLKPENIMLGDFGEAYVLDWGVAKVIGEDDGDFADIDSSSGEHATIAGTAIGTPGYMSPEQARGSADVDGRADVYTLGCLLFEILAGEPLHPRGPEGLRSALAGLDTRPSMRALQRTIAPELDTLCLHATAGDREARMTARELGERVQRYLDGDRDLSLRRKLAREHLERARGAFAAAAATAAAAMTGPQVAPKGTRLAPPAPPPALVLAAPAAEAARASAMREAAAALALDPTLDGAAELVGRLMLEPPRETPREVEVLIAAEDVRLATINTWAGMWSLAAALAFMPLVWWISPGSNGHVAALTTLFATNLAISAYTYVTRRPRPGLHVLMNALVVAMTAVMFSPVLVAPGVAATLGLAMATTPRFSWLGSGAAITALMTGATLGPLLLERLGVLPETMTFQTRGMWLHGPGLAGGSTAILLVGTVYIVLLIAGACVMGDAMRTRIRAASRTMHLQAWQLRQLVPAAT